MPGSGIARRRSNSAASGHSLETDVRYHRATARAGFLRTIAILSTVIAIGIAFRSLAADPKPDAVITIRNIEARVFLDDKIKADAALAADCLADGKKWLDKNATDAAATRRLDPQFFENG